MAKTHHLDHPSNLEIPPTKIEGLETTIEELQKEDYSSLSSSLLQKGEFYLLNGDIGGLDYFDMAIKLDPENSKLLLDQGLSLFEYGSHEGKEEGLTLASKRFKKATKLNPSSFEAWHLWGNTLYLLGIRKGEPSYFTNALKKYEKALTFSKDEPPDVLADLYWDLGDLWSKLAKISGEATDIYSAIKAYEKGASLQEGLPLEFWIGFGNVYMEMGTQTNDLRFFIKAINAYKNAVSTAISSSRGWFFLGKALKNLYSYSHDEDHFAQANECFKTATELSSKEPSIYLEWAHLLLESGTIFRDGKKLHECVDKCYKAYLLNRNDLKTIALWSEALAILGVVTDRLDTIHEALSKIDFLADNTEDQSILYSIGMCYTALGIYYHDTDYYYQATEKFQEGLSLDRSEHRLWYAIASSTYAAALIDFDDKSFERACNFFEKALSLKKMSTYHAHYAMCLLKFGELIHDKTTMEDAIFHFEEAINLQKNASYLHPDWIFSYAITLDHVGEFLESDTHHLKALDLLNHILMQRPEFPQIHYQLALTFTHYGELVLQPEIYHRAIHHFRIAHQREKENDQIILDWALTLVSLGDLLENDVESDQIFREAEYKMIQAAKLGNLHAYYALACLYCVIGDFNNSLRFLEKAKQFDALPPREEILEDDWLENLRETEDFQTFIEELVHDD